MKYEYTLRSNALYSARSSNHWGMAFNTARTREAADHWFYLIFAGRCRSTVWCNHGFYDLSNAY